MKNIWLSLLPLLLLATPAQAKLNVVATTPDLASIAKEIGGDHIDLTILAKPTEDPHFVDAKPSFIIRFNRADLLIVIGLGLEDGWLPSLLRQARNGKILPGASASMTPQSAGVSWSGCLPGNRSAVMRNHSVSVAC